MLNSFQSSLALICTSTFLLNGCLSVEKTGLTEKMYHHEQGVDLYVSNNVTVYPRFKRAIAVEKVGVYFPHGGRKCPLLRVNVRKLDGFIRFDISDFNSEEIQETWYYRVRKNSGRYPIFLLPENLGKLDASEKLLIKGYFGENCTDNCTEPIFDIAMEYPNEWKKSGDGA